MGENRCLFPGSFDPVTLGHMDVIERAAGIFDEVIVGVLHNPEKQGCFPVEKRVEMLERACRALPNVRVLSYGGLLADLTREMGVRVVVRGVRTVSDLESENVMARVNRQLNPQLETLYLPASAEVCDVSASLVRQLAAFGADISSYVPKEICRDVVAAFQKEKKGH